MHMYMYLTGNVCSPNILHTHIFTYISIYIYMYIYIYISVYTCTYLLQAFNNIVNSQVHVLCFSGECQNRAGAADPNPGLGRHWGEFPKIGVPVWGSRIRVIVFERLLGPPVYGNYHAGF